jgi:hypothetical protein
MQGRFHYYEGYPLWMVSQVIGSISRESMKFAYFHPERLAKYVSLPA